MIDITRVCIPLGLKCNLKCKYCYRDFARRELPSELSEDMKVFLKQLTPEKCECVCMSGGEPLLYWDKIKEVFSYVPKNVHKKIMTNGILITEEILNYVNDNDVEVWVSHDGEYTKYLRGADVFEMPQQLELIRKIKILVVNSVITKYNTNVMKNYEYIVKKLRRRNFIYRYTDLMNTGNVDELIEDFDYDEFARTHREFQSRYARKEVFYFRLRRPDGGISGGFNIDLFGNVISMATLKKYGNIHDTYNDCIKVAMETDMEYCSKQDCPFNMRCGGTKQTADAHYCKCRKIKLGLA